MIAFDLRTHRGNQFVVLHSRRAGSRTSQTSQTTIEMADNRWSEVYFALIQGIHQVDSPPWRVHLRAQDAITRASRETKTTMHASIDQFWFGRMFGIEGWELHTCAPRRGVGGSMLVLIYLEGFAE